jgi:SET domain-containing protein
MTRKRRSPVPRYRVGRSNTGLGLFATAPIRKGSFIIEYKGRRITTKESERKENRGARYMYELDDKWTVDGAARSNTARYANHACRPNAESDVVKRKIIIRAIKNIKEGDEITYDYGEAYFAAYLTRRGCKCTTCVKRRAKQRKEYRLRAERRKKREAAALRKKPAAKRKTSRAAR